MKVTKKSVIKSSKEGYRADRILNLASGSVPATRFTVGGRKRYQFDGVSSTQLDTESLRATIEWRWPNRDLVVFSIDTVILDNAAELASAI